MRWIGLTAGLMAALLAIPAYAAAQDDPAPPQDGLRSPDSGNENLPEALRDRRSALLERLRNADLTPAQKRRIYNALVNDFRNRDFRNRRDLGPRSRPRAQDRPRDPSRDVRPPVGPGVRPEGRPPAARAGRPPVQARRGRAVARAATGR